MNSISNELAARFAEVEVRQSEPEEITKVYAVAIINTEQPEAAACISSFTTEAQADRFRAKALEWIQKHDCMHFLKVDADSMPLNSEEYLTWLEETYG